YYGIAKNLILHHAFSVAESAPFYPDAYHTPVYPFFIAALLYLSVPLFGVVLVQDIFAALTVVLIYRLAREMFASRAVALSAGILALLEPMSIYWSGLLMSDVVFAFLMILSFYLLYREFWVSTGIVLGLAALTRPIAILFLPSFLVLGGYVL